MSSGRTARTAAFVLAGLVVTLLLAGVVSHYASRHPDGLNRVAIDTGIDRRQRPHAAADSPLAGYATRGVTNPWLSRGLAGVAGVAVTFLVTGAAVLVVRRRQTHPDTGSRDGDPSEGTGAAGSSP